MLQIAGSLGRGRVVSATEVRSSDSRAAVSPVGVSTWRFQSFPASPPRGPCSPPIGVSWRRRSVRIAPAWKADADS